MIESDDIAPGGQFNRYLARVFPGWALRREQTLRAFELTATARAYEAASHTRRTSGWLTSGASANSEIGAALKSIRNRSRDLDRNNELANSARRQTVANYIGIGIKVDPVNKAEKKAWLGWATSKLCDWEEQLDFYGLQKLVETTVFVSGEVLIRKRIAPPESAAKMNIPLQLQVLEPDHLDDTKTYRKPGDTGFVLLGVDFDRWGKRLGYWLFDAHPGDTVGHGLSSYESKFVPVSEVIHVYNKDRPSQIRGVPMMAVAMMRMRDTADYETALRIKKKIEACFVAFVHGDDVTTNLGDIKTGKSASGKKEEHVSPGLIKYLKQNEQVTFGQPANTADGGEYLRHSMHMIAAGVGMNYMALTGDYGDANYASSKMARTVWLQDIEQIQWLRIVPMLIEPIREWWREAAFLASGKRYRSSTEDRITMPKKAYVDPGKDIKADIAAARAGITSIPELIRQQGNNPEDVLAETAEFQAKARELTVLLDSNPQYEIDIATAKKQESSDDESDEETEDDDDE